MRKNQGIKNNNLRLTKLNSNEKFFEYISRQKVFKTNKHKKKLFSSDTSEFLKTLGSILKYISLVLRNFR